MSYQRKVAHFHKVFGHPCPNKVEVKLSQDLKNLRYNLILEEFMELKTALYNNDSKETLDALCDILYVTMGYRVVCGFAETENVYLDQVLSCHATSFDEKSGDVVEIYVNMLHYLISYVKYTSNLDNFTDLDKILNKINYVTFELGHYLNYDLNTAFQRVHDSNMSKICATEEIAKETIEKYKQSDTKLAVNYRKAEFGGFVVYNEETGKILKSCRFKRPDFTGLY